MDKTVSVIIPNYNQGQYLLESLRGITRQSYQAQEILVVDDGSTDSSMEVLQRFALEEPSLRILSLPENRGVAEAATLGLAAAQGELVYHSAADDPIMESFLESSVRLLERHPQAGLCVTDTRGIHVNGSWETVRFGISTSPSYISPERFWDFASQQDFLDLPTHTATYYRQKQIDCGGIIKPLKWHHDWFVALVVAMRHGICYHPETLKWLRWNSESYSFTGQRDRASQQQVIMAILELLESPAYSDVREFFKTPSILGRFGFKILDLLFEHERFWPYFSWELFARTLQRENVFVEELDFNVLRGLSRQRQIQSAREILETSARQVEQAAENYVAQRNFEDAIFYYMKMCDLRPNSDQMYFKLGASYIKCGWPEHGLRVLEKAASLDPANEETARLIKDTKAALNHKPDQSTQWNLRWVPVWSDRDWPPYRLGQRLWAGPADTRPGDNIVGSVTAIIWNVGDGQELDLTLQDLALQTMLPGEVVLVGQDPGPIQERWGSRLPRLRWEPSPAGPYQMPWSERVLSLAGGDYLLFLASGDRLDATYLSQAVNALHVAPRVAVCYAPRWSLSEHGSESRLFSPVDLSEFGDEAIAMERGFLLRRHAAHFPSHLLMKLEWLGGWFLGLYTALDRGACLLNQPLVQLNPARIWPGAPSPEEGQRWSAVAASLLNTVMNGKLRYLRPLLAYGGFLARVGYAPLIKALMPLFHLWNNETLFVMQYPFYLWNQERASRWSGRQPATPTDHLADFDRGRTAVREGRIREAEGIFRELTQTRPDFAPAYASLAVLASSRGQHSLAREQLEKACQLDPGNSQAWLQLGKAYRSLGQMEQANRAFKNVLASEPGNQEALGCLENMSAGGAG